MSSPESTFNAQEVAAVAATPAPIRVLFVDVRDSIGGDSTVLLHILRRIDRGRFTPYVACHERGALYDELKSLPGLKLLPLPFGTRDASLDRTALVGRMRSLFGFWQTFLCVLRLVAVVWRHRISVLHTNNTVRAVLVTNLVSRLTGIPYIYHAHSALQDHPVQRRGARQADLVLAVSEYTGRTYEPTGMSPARCEVLYNGVDPFELDPSHQSSVRQSLGITADKVLIGLVGRITPNKGHEDLIEAAESILSRVPHAMFVIVGDDSILDNNEGFTERLRHQIYVKGLVDKVIFLGFRRDLRDIYAALDLVLVPSRTPEGCNMVALEAMAMGRPLITSDAGGMPEITRGEYGLVVPAGNPTALAAAVIRVLTDATLATRLQQAGRARVLDRFNVHRYINDFEQILTRLARR